MHSLFYCKSASSYWKSSVLPMVGHWAPDTMVLVLPANVSEVPPRLQPHPIFELHCVCKCFLNLRIVGVKITAVRLWNTTAKEGPALVPMAWLSLSSLQWQASSGRILILKNYLLLTLSLGPWRIWTSYLKKIKMLTSLQLQFVMFMQISKF